MSNVNLFHLNPPKAAHHSQIFSWKINTNINYILQNVFVSQILIPFCEKQSLK